MWLEDPVPPENIRAIGAVQRNTRTPIATGENHYLRLDFERLITEGGLRILAPDVQKIGLWNGRKLADLADLHYVNLAFHNISSPLGTMAGVHLSTSVPNVLALEWHAASVPFFDDLVKNARGPMIEKGKVVRPIKDMRFTQSITEALRGTVALGRERRLCAGEDYEYHDGYSAPALQLKAFYFSSVTR